MESESQIVPNGRKMAFRWHSTIVEPARSCGSDGTSAAATTAQMPSAGDPAASASQRILESAYRDMVDAGAGLDRDGEGKIKDPRPLLRAVERGGVRLGAQGAGMLIALSDRVPIRPPSYQEFQRCVLMEGGAIPGPQAALPPQGRGRGLGHLCTVSAAPSAPGAARGRGRGAASAAQMLRGPGGAAPGGRGAGQQQPSASMRASMGGVRRAGEAPQAPMGASMGRGRGGQR